MLRFCCSPPETFEAKTACPALWNALLHDGTGGVDIPRVPPYYRSNGIGGAPPDASI
jgi:hypothetical protein